MFSLTFQVYFVILSHTGPHIIVPEVLFKIITAIDQDYYIEASFFFFFALRKSYLSAMEIKQVQVFKMPKPTAKVMS